MTVLVVAEVRNGVLRSVSNEIVTAARQIAGSDEVHVIAFGGQGTAATVAPLAGFGADSMLVIEDAALTRYNPEVAAATIAALTKANGYRAVLLAASAEGRDLAPRVAASLDVPLAADVTSIASEGDAFLLTHPVYTGKAIATLRLTANPAVISIRPGAYCRRRGSARWIAADIGTGLRSCLEQGSGNRTWGQDREAGFGRSTGCDRGWSWIAGRRELCAGRSVGRCVRECGSWRDPGRDR